jgi:hypothetical protein
VLRGLSQFAEFVERIGHARVPPFEVGGIDGHRQFAIAPPLHERLRVALVLDEQRRELRDMDGLSMCVDASRRRASASSSRPSRPSKMRGALHRGPEPRAKRSACWAAASAPG